VRREKEVINRLANRSASRFFFSRGENAYADKPKRCLAIGASLERKPDPIKATSRSKKTNLARGRIAMRPVNS